MNEQNPFSIFGISPSFSIDLEKIEELYFEFNKTLHPDRNPFLSAAEKSENQSKIAKINEAYTILKDPEKRIDALLKLNSIELTTKNKSAIPEELAEEYFEYQEARMDGDQISLENKKLILQKKIESALAELNQKIITLAQNINWVSVNKNDIETIIQLKTERAYMKSLKINLVSGGVFHD
jgi:molecular chaperone HscB